MSVTAVSDVSELRTLIQTKVDPAYAKKMFHAVPNCPTVKDRAAYLVAKAQGQVVVDVGCTGPISKKIREVAMGYFGVDRVPPQDGEAWDVVDLDADPYALPAHAFVTLVILSEVLEHLSNPGRLLDAIALKYPGVDVIVTVPNVGSYRVYRECEVVNREHVAWYSYTTLLALLTRHRYVVTAVRWANGAPHKAEGLIVRGRTP